MSCDNDKEPRIDNFETDTPPSLQILEPLRKVVIDDIIKSFSKFNSVQLNALIEHLQPYCSNESNYGLLFYSIKHKQEVTDNKKYDELDEGILNILKKTCGGAENKLAETIRSFSETEKKKHDYKCRALVTNHIDLDDEDKFVCNIIITYPKGLVASAETLMGKDEIYTPVLIERCATCHLNKLALDKKLFSDESELHNSHNSFSKAGNVIAYLKKSLDVKSATELEEDEDYPLTEKEFVQIATITGNEKPKVKLYNRFGIKVKEGLSTKEELLKKPEDDKTLEAEFSEVENTPEIKEVETQAPVSLAIKPGYNAERLKRHSELDKEILAKILSCKDARDWYWHGDIDMAIRTYEEYEKTLKKETPESVVEKVVEETTNTFSTVDTDDEDETDEDEFDDGLEEAMSTTIVNEENDEEEESEEEEDNAPVEPVRNNWDYYVTPTESRRSMYVPYSIDDMMRPDYIKSGSTSFMETSYKDIKENEIKYDKLREIEKEKLKSAKVETVIIEDEDGDYELPEFIDEGEEDFVEDEDDIPLNNVTLKKEEREAIDDIIDTNDEDVKRIFNKAILLDSYLRKYSPPAFERSSIAGMASAAMAFIKQNTSVDTDLLCFDLKIPKDNSFYNDIINGGGKFNLLNKEFIEKPYGESLGFERHLKEQFVRYIEKLRVKNNTPYNTSFNITVRVKSLDSKGLHVVGGLHVDSTVFKEKEKLGTVEGPDGKEYWAMTLKNSIVSCVADYFKLDKTLANGNRVIEEMKTKACKLMSKYVSFNLSPKKSSYLFAKKDTEITQSIVDRFLKMAGVDFSEA